MTETTLFSITLRLAGDVTIFEISYMPLSAVSLYLTLPGTVTVLASTVESSKNLVLANVGASLWSAPNCFAFKHDCNTGLMTMSCL